jgi:hypothetical protein
MNETLLTIFVAVTAVAVILQMVILAALFFSTKKTSARIDAIAKRVEEDVLPAIEQARALINENGPKVTAILTHASETTAIVRAQAERVSATLDDIVDRTRLQTIRADEMVTKTFDRIEQTADTMQHVVLSPIRRLSGIMTGVMVGLGEFVGSRKVRRTQGAVPHDEMFI